MSHRHWILLTLSLGLIPLAAQEVSAQEPNDAPKTTGEKDCGTRQEKSVRRGHHCAFGRWEHRHGGSIQALRPSRDLGERLEQRLGAGLGLHSSHADGRQVRRTRFEWNVIPEGGAVGLSGTRTRAENLLLSFDRQVYLQKDRVGVYVVGGLGGVRWVIEQRGPLAEQDLRTTKLAVTAGLGWQFTPHVALEARYVTSGLTKTFDANTFYTALAWTW